MQRYPQKARRNLPHKLPHDINRKLVRARQRPRVVLEVISRELQDCFQLLQFEFLPREFRRVKRGFIVVAKQVLVVGTSTRYCSAQEMLGENYSGSEPWAVGAIAAFANPVKSIAGRDHPRIRRWTL